MPCSPVPTEDLLSGSTPPRDCPPAPAIIASTLGVSTRACCIHSNNVADVAYVVASRAVIKSSCSRSTPPPGCFYVPLFSSTGPRRAPTLFKRGQDKPLLSAHSGQAVISIVAMFREGSGRGPWGQKDPWRPACHPHLSTVAPAWKVPTQHN